MARSISCCAKISRLLSGEFILADGRRANGGDVVVLRALWVTTYVTVLALLLKSVLDESRGWRFCISVLMTDLRCLSPWISAAFGGIYLAFYSRFAAQWSYLANMYNQIKQAEVTRSNRAISSTPLTQWKAGFIEDAHDLHLASKPSIAGVICAWSQNPAVKNAFIQHTPGGQKRWDDVLVLAKEAKAKVDKDWLPSTPTE